MQSKTTLITTIASCFIHNNRPEINCQEKKQEKETNKKHSERQIGKARMKCDCEFENSIPQKHNSGWHHGCTINFIAHVAEQKSTNNNKMA